MKITAIALMAAALWMAAACDRSTVQGPAGQKLSLDKPSNVALVRGGVVEVSITIHRQDLPGAVSVSFDKLPSGVSAVDADIPIVNGDQATYHVKASASADLVQGYEALVTVKGSDGIAVSQPLGVSVAEK